MLEVEPVSERVLDTTVLHLERGHAERTGRFGPAIRDLGDLGEHAAPIETTCGRVVAECIDEPSEEGARPGRPDDWRRRRPPAVDRAGPQEVRQAGDVIRVQVRERGAHQTLWIDLRLAETTERARRT